MTDPIEFGKELGRLVRDALDPVLQRLKTLEERQPEKGDPGRDADPVDVEALSASVEERVQKSAMDLLAQQTEVIGKRLEVLESREPAKGEPGKDADQVDVDAVADLVISKLLTSDRVKTLIQLAAPEAVSEYFVANPVTNGKDADPEHIAALVKEAVAAIPAPKDGRDADPIGEDQIAAQVATYLKANPPKDGADGAGLAGAMIDRGGELIVTTSKGEAIRLGKVVGEDGRDGIDFDNAAGQYDPERGFVITLGKGERAKDLVLPYMVHKGFWREGLKTCTGESITHDGALWIAKRDNASKPCLENGEDWILAARKGRDGKDGKIVKIPAEPVRLGADHD